MVDPQQRALAHVTALATGGPVDTSWRVTLHFHPDRLVAGVPILQRMACDGVYRSQFETRTSNGGLTAHPGGDRWRWESRMFAGAYDDGAATDRPKIAELSLPPGRWLTAVWLGLFAPGSPYFGPDDVLLSG